MNDKTAIDTTLSSGLNDTELKQSNNSEIKTTQGSKENLEQKLGKQKNISKVSKESDGPKELGGPKGLEPTRYGDWESKGRCYDF